MTFRSGIHDLLFWLSAISFLLPYRGRAQETPWQESLQELRADSTLRNASWSVYVKDLERDSVVIDHNSQLSLIPASTMKIITTATALAILGPQFQYETFLEHDGTLDASTGVLKGNLYIKGNGDPTLGSSTFRKKSDTIALADEWAALLYSIGIRRIEGSVIGDARSFEDELVPYSWIWGDMGNYYGAGACALNFSDNKFSLYFRSGGKRGDSTVLLRIDPVIPGLKIYNLTTSRGYSDNAYIYGSPYQMARYVKGTIPMNKKEYEVEGSMPDPPLFCAQMLDSALRKKNIAITGNAYTLRNYLPSSSQLSSADEDTLPLPSLPDRPDRKVLYRHTSHLLERIAAETNIQSNNLFAESLLKTIAWKKNKYGDDQTAIDLTINFWKKKGVKLDGFYMADGSGLSRFNAMSTRHQVDLLAAIQKDSLLFQKFFECLPIAGKSGSLGRLMKGTRAENNLRAKSGYMTRVRSYAGYVRGKHGRWMAFSVIVNNYTCTPAQMKEKLEKLMASLAEIG